MSIVTLLYLAAALAVGGFSGWILRKSLAKREVESIESKADKLLSEARARAKEILISAKDRALEIREEAKKEEEERRRQIAQLEGRLQKREENLDNKLAELEKKSESLKAKEKEIEEIKQEITELKEKQKERLSQVGELSRQEARELLLELVEKEMKEELVRKIRQAEEKVSEEAEKKAREIIGQAIQRYAAPHTAESTISTVQLPSDEMKGRIIGREGRNIQAFERVTGVDLIVDDTPEVVVISAFDPIRRAVAKMALEKLIADGRIQPARIESVVAESREKISEEVKEAGETACYEVGVAGLPPDLVKILGRLKFRTSYGQNVLRHSVEVAFIASMLASEIGADAGVCKKAGLLHDIGKALDHEISGSHAIIGRDIAKKFGLEKEVIHAIEAHHEEVPFESVEAMLVQAADAISGARPGARRETLEAYVKRLEELENIANSFPGVEKSYAIQAGREIRIFVKPEEIDDLEALKLAKNIASKIEQELKYPGQIKVNVIREVRAQEVAQ